MTPSAPRRQARPARAARRPRSRVIVLIAAGALAGLGATLAMSPRPSAGGAAGPSQTPAALAAVGPRGAAVSGERASGAGATAATGGTSETGLAATAPSSAASAAPSARSAEPFPHGLLIADRANGRIIAVDSAGAVFWTFPVPGSLPRNRSFAADDAFVSPDGRTVVANDESHHVVYRIDIATRRVVWQYGHFDVPGSGDGYLHTPDDAYPLANGDIVVADIVNCRVLEIAPDKRVVRQFGVTGACRDNAPHTYGDPNGDTPLPDGGLLITEITGSRVVRLSPTGAVLFDIHVPVAYPSDAQLDARGNVIVVDYSNPGAVVAMTQAGRLLWRWGPRSGPWRMDHPSLGTPLPDGNIVINDDGRDRVTVLDPTTRTVVWQYGHTDVAGAAPGYLADPDGHQPIPANAAF